MVGHLVTAQHGHEYGTSPAVEYCGNVSQEGGLWASFFDWLLGSGWSISWFFCTLGAGGGVHLWFSLQWPASCVGSGLLAARGGSHTHFLAGKGWGYRSGAVGDQAGGWLTWLLPGFTYSGASSPFTSVHSLPTADPSSLSVLVNDLLNKFELQNVPNKAHFLLFPSFKGPRLPSCSVQIYDPFSLSLQLQEPLSPPLLPICSTRKC